MLKVPCTCACHQPDVAMMHMFPCCNAGFIDVPETLEEWVIQQQPCLYDKKDEATKGYKGTSTIH